MNNKCFSFDYTFSLELASFIYFDSVSISCSMTETDWYFRFKCLNLLFGNGIHLQEIRITFALKFDHIMNEFCVMTQKR